ncbi:hypothetical protein [Planctomycetes bacterium Pla163]|uniref:hypothetical protein n=1 Tax=Rohdeia mirabilis TaxID=2528008 RepID=UPI0011A0F7F5
MARALDAVERRELLRCLVEAAAALLCARWGGDAPIGRVPAWIEQPWIERVLARSSGGQGWRTRARTCLWMCLARGADDEGLELLAALVDRRRRAWPAASGVLAAARLVHGGPVVAHLHATALELEGRLDAARRAYLAELDRPGGRRRLPRAFEGLARVHRRAGRPRAALAAAATDWHPVSLAAAAWDARILRRDGEAQRWTALVESALRDACGQRSARIAAALCAGEVCASEGRGAEVRGAVVRGEVAVGPRPLGTGRDERPRESDASSGDAIHGGAPIDAGPTFGTRDRARDVDSTADTRATGDGPVEGVDDGE